MCCALLLVHALFGGGDEFEEFEEEVEGGLALPAPLGDRVCTAVIFLGLLGTFYGLATTVPAVVETIRSLNPSENEGSVEVFSRLMAGLENQLGGMGTAFASSLLGLAGSLVVGVLELFASHGQNRFYRQLEDWLSSITRVNLANIENESGSQTSNNGMLDEVLV